MGFSLLVRTWLLHNHQPTNDFYFPIGALVPPYMRTTPVHQPSTRVEDRRPFSCTHPIGALDLVDKDPVYCSNLDGTRVVAAPSDSQRAALADSALPRGQNRASGRPWVSQTLPKKSLRG